MRQFFQNLRATRASDAAAQVDRHAGQHQGFALVVEYKGFGRFRNRIGYDNANGLMMQLSRPLVTLPKAFLGRANRTNVEIAFAAGSQEHADELLGEILPRLSERVSFQGIEYDPDPVLGVCEISDSALSDIHFDRAAAAIAIATRSNQTIRFATDDIALEDRSDQIALLHDLQEAIEHKKLNLAYMPKLNMRTGQIEAAECLCRWEHPIRGDISPQEFIAMADESGLMEKLTKWITGVVVRDQRALAEQGISIQLDVNLSAGLVCNTEFCSELVDLVKDAPGRIGFEITETSVIDKPDVALENLQDLVSAGAWLAIDDYGSGLSSLSYLRGIPAHELKIDKSFVMGLTKSNRDPLLVRSSIELAHSLEMLITAEGVEDEMTCSLLQVMGCDFVQGYWISKALPIKEFAEFYFRFKEQSAILKVSDQETVPAKRA